jgi:hypothetical protein
MPEASLAPAHGLKETDWKTLLDRIQTKRCIPFIGPGLCKNSYRTKATIAELWAECEDYPFEDKRDLARVSQFLEVKAEDKQVPIDRLIAEFASNNKVPDFKDQYEPHRVLAELPFPIYITTNYDNYMMKVLNEESKKDPQRGYCHWRERAEEEQAKVLPPVPTVANPFVFHLYGHTDEPESLVLTEEHYMRFLIKDSKFPDTTIPMQVQKALVGKSLLFFGYQVDDWDFRILLTFLDRFFQSGLRDNKHVSAQLAPFDEKATPQQRERAQEHFNRYLLKNFNVSIYWGTCEEFAKELLDRFRSKDRGG